MGTRRFGNGPVPGGEGRVAHPPSSRRRPGPQDAKGGGLDEVTAFAGMTGEACDFLSLP